MNSNTKTANARPSRMLATGFGAVALLGAVALGGCGDDEDEPVGTDVNVGTTMVTGTMAPGTTMVPGTVTTEVMTTDVMTTEAMTTEPTATTGG